MIRKTWRSDKWISDEYNVSRDIVKETAKRICNNKDWIKKCKDGTLQQKGEVYDPILVEKIINEINRNKPTFSSKKLPRESLHKFESQKYFQKHFEQTALDKNKIKALVRIN